MTLAAETLQPVHEMNLDELQLEIDLALAMNTVPMNLSLGYRQSASVDNLRTVVAECRQFAELRREDPHATELPRTPPPKKPKTSPV